MQHPLDCQRKQCDEGGGRNLTLILSAKLNNVGTMLYKAGRENEAMSFYEEALTARLSVLESASTFPHMIYASHFAKKQIYGSISSIAERLTVTDQYLLSLIRSDTNKSNPKNDHHEKRDFNVSIEAFSEDALDIFWEKRESNSNYSSYAKAVTEQDFKIIYNIALIYGKRKNFARAIELFATVASMISEFQEYFHIGGFCMQQIGRMNYMNKHFGTALEAFREAEKRGKLNLLFNVDHRNNDHLSQCIWFITNVQVCTGMTCIHLNHFEMAMEYCEEALSLQMETVNNTGPRIVDMALTISTIAFIYQSQGDSKKAVNYYQKVFALARERNFEKNHPYFFSCNLHNMGVVLLEERKVGKALSFLRRALHLRREILGERNVEVAMTMLSIAQALHVEQNHADALNFYEKALIIQKCTLGERSSEAISTMCNIAHVLRVRCELGEAAEVLKRALQLSRQCICEAVPISATILKMMGLICLEMGEDISGLLKLEEAKHMNTMVTSLDIDNDSSITLALRLSAYDVVRRPHAAAA